jgi:urease accessory protein UreF
MIAVAVPAATAKAKTAKAMSFFMVLLMGSAIAAAVRVCQQGQTYPN